MYEMQAMKKYTLIKTLGFAYAITYYSTKRKENKLSVYNIVLQGSHFNVTDQLSTFTILYLFCGDCVG